MKITHNLKNLLAFAGVSLLAGSANAASSFLATWQSTIASEQHPTYAGEARYYHVSINENNSGIGSYASTVVGTNTPAGTFTKGFGGGEVVAYSFLGGTNNSVAGRVEESGGLISWSTDDTTFDGFGQGQLKFWDTTDPGADLATGGADPFNAVDNGGGGGYRSFGGAVTTIDISGIFMGSVYAFYGAFNSTPTVSAVMRDLDGGAPDILIANAHTNGDFANRTEYYAAELKFTNDAGYDVIEYTWLANGVDYTGNGRGAGALLVQIPEPSTTALLSLGGLALILRRRK